MSDATTDRTGAAPGPGDHEGAPDHRGGEPEGEVTSWLRRAVIAAAVIFIGVRISLPTLVVILALIFFIFMHELGHYLTARWAGMKVTEFFIGFGPRLWSFRRGETEYGVKAIPAGAYVRIIGMTNLEEVDPADEHRTYRQKPYWRRLSVAVAGSTMHFLMAIVLLFSIVSVFGVPDPEAEAWTVGAISQPSAAADADLRPGDRIAAIDGRSFASFDDTASYLRERPGDLIELTVVRGGDERRLEVRLGERETAEGVVGFLGVGPEFPSTRMNPFSGAVEAVRETGSTMVLSVKALGQFFSPDGITGYIDTVAGSTSTSGGSTPAEEAGDRLLSPVGAVHVASQVADAGVVDLLSFLFMINVFIGVFNLVPLLPFDGGHVVIATYERLRSRGDRRYHADVTKLMPLTYAVVAVLVVVGVSALYLDISNPIELPF